MSTRFDILDARKRARSHQCSAGTCGGYPCPVQRELNSEHLQVAGRWGMGEDGESFDDRQRRQYNERVAGQ